MTVRSRGRAPPGFQTNNYVDYFIYNHEDFMNLSPVFKISENIKNAPLARRAKIPLLDPATLPSDIYIFCPPPHLLTTHSNNTVHA